MYENECARVYYFVGSSYTLVLMTDQALTDKQIRAYKSHSREPQPREFFSAMKNADESLETVLEKINRMRASRAPAVKNSAFVQRYTSKQLNTTQVKQ
jgi:hypothetical protein